MGNGVCRAAAILAFLVGAASAVPLTWDADLGTGGLQDGGGTWDTSTSRWWTGSGYTTWSNSNPDSATFGVGGPAAGTVTLGEPITAGGITFNAPASYTVSGDTLTLAGPPTIAANVNATIASALAGTGFTKTGNGFLTLGGPSANTYAGTTVLSAGKLVLAKPAGVNAIGGDLTVATSANWIVGSATGNGVELAAAEQIPDSAAITFSGTDWCGFRPKGFNETLAGISCTNGKGVIENFGYNQPNAGQNATLTINNASNYTYNGWIRNVDNVGTSTLAVAKGGAGTLTLQGNLIFYTGPTTVSAGTLKLADATAFSSPITLSGGTVEFSLSGANSYTYAKPIAGGAGSLAKTGTGTLTLASSETYNGATTISQGTLRLQMAPATPLPGSALWLDGADASTLFKDTLGTQPVAASNDPVALWRDKSGNARDAVQATVANQPTYQIAVQNGLSVVRFDAANDGMATGLSVAGGDLSAFVVYDFRGTDTGMHRAIQGTANWLVGPYSGQYRYYAGNWVGAPPSAVQNQFVYQTAVQGSNAATNYVNGVSYGNLAGVTYPGILRLGSATGNPPYPEPLNGDIAEVLAYNTPLTPAQRSSVEAYLALKWLGTGTAQNVLPTNTAVAIASGATLEVSSGSQTIGSLADSGGGGGSVVLNNATLVTGGSGASTLFSGTISGNGSLGKAGGGTFTLTGNNTYIGPTTVAAGTLQVGNGGTSGTLGTGSVTNDASLVFNRSDNLVVSNLIGGTGSVTKTGAGTLSYMGPGTYSGATIISQGTLRLLAAPSAPLAGSALWLDGSDASTLFKDTAGTQPVASPNDPVALWKDKSGNARNATQAIAANQPTYQAAVQNGLSAVRFDAANDGMLSGLAATGGDLSVFAVYDFRGTDTGLHRAIQGSNNWLLGPYAGQYRYHAGNWVGTPPGVTQYQFIYQTAVQNATLATNYVNGTSYGTLANPIYPGTVSLGGSGMYPGEILNGDIAELLVYTTALTAAQRQAVEAYLASKWFGVGASSNILPVGSAVQIANGATLDLNGVAQTIASLADGGGGGGGAVINSAAATPLALTFDPAAGSTTFSGTIGDGSVANAISLVKNGLGTQVLSGTNTYHGTTTVNQGALFINGSITSPVTVTGGLLGGSGTIIGDVTVNGGTISAGTSPGHLTLNASLVSLNATLLAELGGTGQGTTYDWIEVIGQVTLAGLIDVDFVNSFIAAPGMSFDILTASGGITNPTLSGVAFDYYGADFGWPWVAEIVSLGGSAEALRLTASPEPATLTLLALGGLALLRRRRR